MLPEAFEPHAAIYRQGFGVAPEPVVYVSCKLFFYVYTDHKQKQCHVLVVGIPSVAYSHTWDTDRVVRSF